MLLSSLGSMSQNDMETLGKFTLRYLSDDELSCWQTWKPVASELTRCLHRTNSRLVQGAGLHSLENENNVKYHKGDSFRSIENQEVSIAGTQDSSQVSD